MSLVVLAYTYHPCVSHNQETSHDLYAIARGSAVLLGTMLLKGLPRYLVAWSLSELIRRRRISTGFPEVMTLYRAASSIAIEDNLEVVFEIPS